MLQTLALAILPLLAPAPPWAWPVGPPHAIVRPYVAPATPYSAGHRGVDLAAPDGAVYAPADGVVHFAGVVVDRPVLSIEQAGGVITSFDPVATTLVVGDPVERGQPIGTVLPGHCASVCLHFGVRLHGEYVSPLTWLGGIERAVLLPTRALAHSESHGSGGMLSGSVNERSPSTAAERRRGVVRWARSTSVTSCLIDLARGVYGKNRISARGLSSPRRPGGSARIGPFPPRTTPLPCGGHGQQGPSPPFGGTDVTTVSRCERDTPDRPHGLTFYDGQALITRADARGGSSP